jgi:hypothetical protein
MTILLKRKDAPAVNALRRTPFGILGASTRDGKREIGNLAEEKSLALEADECSKARQLLTHPRTRLSCEMAWLPGFSPERANDYCELLDRDIDGFFEAARAERALVAANLFAAGIETLADGASNEVWADLILKLGQFADEVDIAVLLRIINEDRKIAGFPEVQSAEFVASEFAQRLRGYKDVVRDALNRMESLDLIEVAGRVANGATDSGRRQAPVLIDDILDGYLLDVRPFLEKEAGNLSKLITSIRTRAAPGTVPIATLCDKLGDVVSNWSRVAQPIQISLKSRGMVHDLSKDVGFKIRTVAMDLSSNPDELKQAQFLTAMLMKHFSHSPDLVDLLVNDWSRLAEIAKKKNDAEPLGRISILCVQATTAAKESPMVADDQARRIINYGSELLTLAEQSGLHANDLNTKRDEMALAICSCVCEYGNKTAKWRQCKVLLEAANGFAVGKKARGLVARDLDFAADMLLMYGGFEPDKTAPSLFTFCGCGVTLYGKNDYHAGSSAYTATYYLVLFFVPLFPICRYRVIPQYLKHYRFLGRGPFGTFDIFHIALSVFLILFLFRYK